jgi:hypothetical protein
MTGWFKAVFPRIYPQIRLPILAVLLADLLYVKEGLDGKIVNQDIRERLARYDRAVTNIGPLPALVLAVLRDPRNAVDHVRNVSAGEWRAKFDALLTDRRAERDQRRRRDRLIVEAHARAAPGELTDFNLRRWRGRCRPPLN